MGQGVRSRSQQATFRERQFIPSSGRFQDDSVKTCRTHSEFGVVGAIKLRAANCRLRGQQRTSHAGTTASMEQGASGVLLLAVANSPRKLPKFSGGQRMPATITAVGDAIA